jgi:hypothetical protein
LNLNLHKHLLSLLHATLVEISSSLATLVKAAKQAGAELGFKILGGQIEKNKFGGAKTIKITKFRSKID